MANCDFVGSCTFFNDVVYGFPAIADYLKSKYCAGNHVECARYTIFKELGKEKVPKGLFPLEKIDLENYR